MGNVLRTGRGSELYPARDTVQKQNTTPKGWCFLFGAGDEARSAMQGIADTHAGTTMCHRHIVIVSRLPCSSLLPTSFQKNKRTSEGMSFYFWSGRRGSNSLPRPWQGRALPDELRPQTQDIVYPMKKLLSTLQIQFLRIISAMPGVPSAG